LAIYRSNRRLQNLVVTITEVVAGNMIPTTNHLILPEIYLVSNPKTLENYGKKMGPLPFLSSIESPYRKKERDPRCGDGGARSRRSYPSPRWRRRRRDRLSGLFFYFQWKIKYPQKDNRTEVHYFADWWLQVRMKTVGNGRKRTYEIENKSG
jgi:hypothetical protein